MVIKLGICDDNIDYLIALEFMVEDIFNELKQIYTVETFSSSVKLKNYLLNSSNTMDILILDIEMPEVDGLEIGRLIRDSKRNTKIIYSTSHIEYSLKAYDNFPFHYLLKPIGKNKLKNIISLAIEGENKGLDYEIILESNQKRYKIDITEIEYIEKQVNKCILKEDNKEFEYYITLKDLEDIILNTGYRNFVKCHQSYLINLRWVWKWESNLFTLKNGDKIPISRKYKKIAEERFKNYFKENI